MQKEKEEEMKEEQKPVKQEPVPVESIPKVDREAEIKVSKHKKI